MVVKDEGSKLQHHANWSSDLNSVTDWWTQYNNDLAKRCHVKNVPLTLRKWVTKSQSGIDLYMNNTQKACDNLESNESRNIINVILQENTFFKKLTHALTNVICR